MKILKILGFSLLVVFWASTPYADIYTWTDQFGIVHFSNHSPPREARVLVKDLERSPRAGGQQDSQEALEERLREANEKVKALEDSLEKAEALEKKLKDANKKTEEALKYVEALAEPEYYLDVGYAYVRSYRPVRYGHRHSYKGHGRKIYRQGVHHKTHGNKKHLKKHRGGNHHKRYSSGTHLRKRHSGARHFRKTHSGFQHKGRFSARPYRR